MYGTNNPVWEDAFTFFIQDPRKQDIDIQVQYNHCDCKILNLEFYTFTTFHDVTAIIFFHVLI